jgi:hypothetical protein
VTASEVREVPQDRQALTAAARSTGKFQTLTRLTEVVFDYAEQSKIFLKLFLG